MPTLQRGEIPHYDEVLVRTIRAFATYCTQDFEAALVEYRVCLAAIRLLHHDGKIDMSDASDRIMSYVNISMATHNYQNDDPAQNSRWGQQAISDKR